MSIKEIEKLKEKVDKDLNSKLFVPLAEEYRKEGMTNEAIAVLQKGLQSQPGYMSARVSLGKIYLEKGNMNEARIEFENVIAAIPDNLYAHKKLAEIYRDTGEKDLAIKAFRTVMKLNPMDEEVLNNLRDIEGASTEQPAEIINAPVSFNVEPAAAQEMPFEAMNLEHTYEKDHVEPAHSAEELDSFKESLFGFKEEKEIPDELPVAKENIAENEADIENVEVTRDDPDMGWSFDNAESAPVIEGPEENIAATEEVSEDADEESSFGDIVDVLKNKNMKEDEAAEILDEESRASEEIAGDEVSHKTDIENPDTNSALLQSADKFILEGNYSGALNIYRRALAISPDDKHIFQRIEDLKSLLKLLGKDREVLISKLEAFLNAIRKRSDEFHRSS